MNELLKTAKNCRHYAMCKIDFLGTGLCKSGAEKHYVSFYPQGRMDLYAALTENKIPVTEKCIEIADSCDLCGKCDYQCYFVTEMKPTAVMRGLKEHIADYLKNGGKVPADADDSILKRLREITGSFWSTNDRAIALTYSHDPCPVASPIMPDYVILPGTKNEVADVVKFLNENEIPYAVRGNGSSVMGFVMSEGAVIDLQRMKSIEFDEKNWFARVGPGVSAFDLQKEAAMRGLRINAAEPSALICANLMCSGIFSLFSASYGTAADNYIDAEFVDKDGNIFSLSDKSSPNLYAFKRENCSIPGICISACVRLHPVMKDEDSALVPFEKLEDALDFAKECAVRRIGIAIGVLGGEYISTFLSPTKKLAAEVKDVFRDKLGIGYLVLIIGDKYSLNTIRQMGYSFIDSKLMGVINLGLPSLKSAGWLDLINELSDDDPFSYLGVAGFAELAETALAPSASKLVREIDPELRPFFEKLYSKPEMTEPVWLNTFRIVSSRMGREKHALAMIVYLPIDNALISEINAGFKSIADNHGIKNDFGFITPLDNGKRCVYEYDYFLDHNNPDEISAMQQALTEAGMMIEKYSVETGTITWIGHVFCQGFSRKESFLYNTRAGS